MVSVRHRKGRGGEYNTADPALQHPLFPCTARHTIQAPTTPAPSPAPVTLACDARHLDQVDAREGAVPARELQPAHVRDRRRALQPERLQPPQPRQRRKPAVGDGVGGAGPQEQVHQAGLGVGGGRQGAGGADEGCGVRVYGTVLKGVLMDTKSRTTSRILFCNHTSAGRGLRM